MAEATEVYPEQSSLREEDDEVFIECLQKVHAGSRYQKSPDYQSADFYLGDDLERARSRRSLVRLAAGKRRRLSRHRGPSGGGVFLRKNNRLSGNRGRE
jgi:hypothetical protein